MNMPLHATVLQNAFNGETFIFPASQEDPSQARLTVSLAPGGTGGGNALVHVHPLADESFTVRSGRLEIIIDGKHEMLYPGESLTIPRGRPHHFANASDGVTNAEVRFSPAQQHLRFFRNFAMLTQARPEWFSAKGDPNLLLIALVLHSYPDHLYLAGPPVWLQKAAFRILSRLAHWRGYRLCVSPHDNTDQRAKAAPVPERL